MQAISLWRLAVGLVCLCIMPTAQAFAQPGFGKSGPAQTHSRNVALPTQNFNKSTQIVTNTNHHFDAKRDHSPLPVTKVHQDAKFNSHDLARSSQGFQAKKFDLAKIHVPTNAHQVAKLNAGHGFQGQKFILNKNVYQGSNYHLQYGQRYGNSWCYPGIHHNHWHHCVWVPNYRCYCYYDPCVCCYYYYNVTDCCYYPCDWVDSTYSSYAPVPTSSMYPSVGYQAPRVQIGVRIGW